MIRYCPNCRTERPLTEFFCEGEIDGSRCNWDLSSEGIHPEGWRPHRIVAGLTAPSAPSILRPVCRNGHPMEDGDLVCAECGAEAALPATEPVCGAEREIRSIEAWVIQSALPAAASFDRYAARHETSGQGATLRLFKTGFEPEPLVYEALQRLSLEHVPRLFAWGRWENRFYSVSESFSGQNLADLGAVIADEAGARHIVRELGEALHSLTEAGIRHRDLKPADLVVRAEKPLDLVITGFGSARLSDFDLDIAAPLETSLYMAPEAIAGAVSPASDWWSLGMILLEQLTGGEIFASIHERAFVIQVLSNGISIPDSLPPALQTLLKGLLTRDHSARWQWPQVKAWLEGRFVELAPEHLAASSLAEQSTAIVLGGQRYASPEQFALRAAEQENWKEGRSLMRGGGLGTWLASIAESFPENTKLREIRDTLSDMQTTGALEAENWDSDRRFMLALKLLNPSMPLVIRGELLSPGWLLANPQEGYALIQSDIPRLLSGCLPDEANWLLQLQTRERQMRERARSLDIPLNEDALRIYSLNTSQSRLAVIWAERLKAYPETDHPGAALLLERHNLTDSDCIILLSADLSLFSPVQDSLDASSRLAKEHRIRSFSRDEAERLLAVPRKDLYRALDGRLRDFAYSGNAALDQWAQEYRIRRRLPLTKILAILATPAGDWATPPLQRHIHELFSHFDKKIAAAGMNSPLANLRTNERSSSIDFTDLGTERTPAVGLVKHILERTPRTVTLDPALFDEAARPAAGRRGRPQSGTERTAEVRAGRPGAVFDRTMAGRLGRLQSKNDAYFRDTGINGLYAGFPFMQYRADQATREPRVMPLLLWPARIEGSVFSRRVRLGFDPDREEVRLNPFLEVIVGPESFKRWEEAANELLSRSSVDVREAMSILSAVADEAEEELRRLMPQERRVPVGKQRLICSAALFHAAFAGQAISEDLRLLAQTAAAPGAMGTAFGLYDAPAPVSSAATDAPSFFVTHTDPSQEKAVQESRSPKGLLIEGPPGTGKSQTIVNMISQALGDKRTVLVICQKRAALDVVHKRLVAEGLSDRIITTTDSGRDRATVISAVRGQMEKYFRDATPSVLLNMRKRKRLLLLIEKLEAEIDASHHAFHSLDPQCGYSYRTILDKLIDLQGKTAGIQAPQLRRLLAALTAAQLEDILEDCAPLATLWLASRYEGSPLHAFELFTPDDASVAALQEELDALRKAEQERADYGDHTACTLPQSQDALFAEWYASCGTDMETMGEKEFDLIRRCLPLFKAPGQPLPVPAGDTLIRELENIAEALAACPMAEYSHLLSPLAAALPDKRLDALYRDSALDTPSFPQVCAPWRILGRMRLSSMLRQAGLEIASPEARAEVHGAARLELALRPLRKRLRGIFLKLGLAPAAEDEILRLSALSRQILQAIRALAPLLASLVQLPEASLLENAFFQGERDAVLTELARFKAASERHALSVRSLELLDVLARHFTAETVKKFRQAIENGEKTLLLLDALQRSMPGIEPFMVFQKRRTALPETAISLFALLRRHEEALTAIDPRAREQAFKCIVRAEALLAWKERLEIQNPLLGMERDELESKVRKLKESDASLRDLNRDILARSINPEKIGPRNRWVEITRLSGARARRLRQFIAEGAEIGLFEFRLVWLMNPDTASRILPLTPNLFDLVIYDEASQMPVEYAVPTLYRAASLVVSGDEKQMPPSGFFSASIAEDESTGDYDEEFIEENAAKREIKDCTDMLQLARRAMPQTTLQIHYRSVYRELINFSNAAFYDDQLYVPARHPVARVLQEKPLRYIAVGGTYKNQTNMEEARAVLDLLEELWRSPRRPSVGVVTFNHKQASCIGDLMAEKALRDDAFRRDYATESARLENGEDMSFFVKNVENVQGDERDVIIFSSTFGRDEAGRFIRNFGALGHKGGERRLNVAITRARKQVILVSSMPIRDISDMLATQRLPLMPRDYLQIYWAYAEALSRGAFPEAELILGRVTPRNGGNGHGGGDEKYEIHADSGIRAAVRACLEQAGWEVSAGEEGSLFDVAFLLEDKRNGSFFLGVECDAPSHPLLAGARAREIWRSDVLRRGIPVIRRISSKAWLENPEREKAGLLLIAERAYGENGGKG